MQRGATNQVHGGAERVRVDREILAMDAVEVYNDRRD